MDLGYISGIYLQDLINLRSCTSIVKFNKCGVFSFTSSNHKKQNTLFCPLVWESLNCNAFKQRHKKSITACWQTRRQWACGALTTWKHREREREMKTHCSVAILICHAKLSRIVVLTTKLKGLNSCVCGRIPWKCACKYKISSKH